MLESFYSEGMDDELGQEELKGIEISPSPQPTMMLERPKHEGSPEPISIKLNGIVKPENEDIKDVIPRTVGI